MRRVEKTIGKLGVLGLAVAGVVISSGHALGASGIWTGGGTDTLWGTAANWSGGVPNSNSDLATFNAALGTGGKGGAADPITIASNVIVKTVTFDTADAGPYVIQTSGPATLRLFAGGGVTVNPTVANSITLNASLLYSNSGGSLVFRNDAGSPSATLNVAGTLSTLPTATSLSNFTLAGTNTGNNSLTTPITNGTLLTYQLIKNDSGTWIIGASNSFGGKTFINGGILVASSLNSVVGGTATSSLGAPTNASNGQIDIGTVASTGQLTYTNTVADETTDRVVRLTGTTGGAILDQSGTKALKFTADFVNPGAGAGNTKVLTLQGSTIGTGEIAGKIPIGGTGVLGILKQGSGTWTVSGSNTFTGPVVIQSGTLQVKTINRIQSHSLTSNLGSPVTIANGTITLGSASDATLRYVGVGEWTDRILNLTSTGGATTLDSSGTGLLQWTANFTNTTATSKTLTLTGTGSGEIAGKIPDYDASNRTGILKTGTGTWNLSGTTAFTGNVTVTGGTLIAGSPLRPVTGSLVVTGPGAVQLGVTHTSVAATGHSVAGELPRVVLNDGGTVSIPAFDRSAYKAAGLSVPVTGLALDGGVLDLGNSDLVVKNGAANTGTVTALLASGHLTASATSATSPQYISHTTLSMFKNDLGDGTPYFSDFDGITGLTASDLIMKYTYIGDLNLDGTVDGKDLSRITEGFSTGQSGWSWGDLNNSGGPISLDDYQSFVEAYTWFTSQASPINLGTGQGDGTGSGSIPEPTGCAALMLGTALLARRRRIAAANSCTSHKP